MARGSQQRTDVGQSSGRSVPLADFMRLNPPSFSNFNETENPVAFLDDIDKICEALRCDNVRKAELAAFRLTGTAHHWYQMYGRSGWTWREFSDAFLARFLPEGLKDELASQFERLAMTSDMPVVQYNRRYMELSRYAPELVDTEVKRIRRYINGLLDPLYRAMRPTTYASLAHAMDVARQLESREMQSRAAREQRKKARSEGQTSSRFGGRDTRASESAYRGYDRSLGSSQSRVGSGYRSQGGSGMPRMGRDAQSRPQQITASVICQTCGKPHSGPCHRETGACFGCGQFGHLRRDCPFSPVTQYSGQSSAQGSVQSPPMQAQSTRSDSSRQSGGRNQFGEGPSGRGLGGRGSRGRGAGNQDQRPQDRGQARVFAMTQQDTRASNAVITGTFSVT